MSVSDAEAQRLLEGIDGPRALPPSLRAELLTTLTGVARGLATTDAPRPLPDDLRQRLEATLVTASARPVPHALRRRVLSATTRTTPRVLQLVAAAAAVLVLLAGVLIAVRPDDSTTRIAGPRREPPPGTTTSPSASAGSDTAAGAATGGSTASGGGTAAVPFADGAGGGTGADRSSSEAQATPDAAASPTSSVRAISVAVAGSDATDVVAGFDAYLRTLNEAGGVHGRPVVTVPAGSPSAVATVNLGSAPALGHRAGDGVLFETLFTDGARLRGDVVSVASALERQARLAVAGAYPGEDDAGGRAAIYVGAAEPWASIVADAFESALRGRGVTAVRVPFSARAPTFVPGADAAFLSLPPADVSAWVADAPGAPDRGTWGVASAWDDRFVKRAGAVGLRVLAPYAPAGGEEQATLADALADQALTAGAVHGWVTAKALAVVLAGNGGERLTAADLDRLAGWDPGWAPEFETRPGTRERTPDAVLLRPAANGFVAEGGFRRDPAG